MTAKFFLDGVKAANAIELGDFLIRYGCNLKQIEKSDSLINEIVKRAYPNLTEKEFKEKVDSLFLACVTVVMSDMWSVTDMDDSCDCEETHYPIIAWFTDAVDAAQFARMMNAMRENVNGE